MILQNWKMVGDFHHSYEKFKKLDKCEPETKRLQTIERSSRTIRSFLPRESRNLNLSAYRRHFSSKIAQVTFKLPVIRNFINWRNLKINVWKQMHRLF